MTPKVTLLETLQGGGGGGGGRKNIIEGGFAAILGYHFSILVQDQLEDYLPMNIQASLIKPAMLEFIELKTDPKETFGLITHMIFFLFED